MNSGNFFAELKRRNVYKVAVAYAIVGWLLVQVATQVFPFLEILSWVVRLVIVLVAIGFPIALIIAWAFELTPEGIKRTEDADRDGERPSRSRAWIYVAVIGAAVSVGLFFIGRYTAAPRVTASAARTETTTASLPEKSIAVLPFDNLSRDPDNAFFAEGVQDEILTRLGKVADLKVISRTSTQRFKSAPDNLPQIAKQLGVMHILEGSVQKSNDALLGAAKGLAGDKSAAEQTLKELDKIAQSQEVDDYSRALVYLGLNNKEEALRAIERTFAARDGSSLNWIKVDPFLDPLRGDPRFEALVQKIIAPTQ